MNHKPRVFILGSNGFVGKHLEKSLKSKSFEVVGWSSKDADLSTQGSVEKMQSAILEKDVVVFVSAITPDRGKDTNAFMKNILMAQNVSAAVEGKLSAQGHLIYISSDAVYADDLNIIRENTPTDSGQLYGQMHRTRELILAAAVAKSKVPFTCLRLNAIYGVGDTHNGYGPNRFIKLALSKNEIALFGEGEEQRDHIFIDDVIQVIIQAIEKKITGTFNIASGRSVSFMSVARVVQETLKKDFQKSVQIQKNKRDPNAVILHKNFDNTKLLETFAGLTMTSLENGIHTTLKEITTNS